MSIETVRAAALALAEAGTTPSITTLQTALPHVKRSTLARHWAIIKAERAAAQPPGEDVAVAVLEPPDAPTSAPDTDQAVQHAREALEAAQRHLAAAQRSPGLGQRISLITAQRAGIITRDDPCWRDFDEAQQQVSRATEAVEDAAEHLKAAERRHLAQLRAQAEARYRATAEGAAIVKEIDRLQALYVDASAREVGSSVSYSHMLGVERARFQAGVSKVLATLQPAELPAPSGLQSRFSVETLRPCYLHDGIGRVMPSGVERFEPADLPVLMELRAILQGELDEAYRALRGYEMDDELSHMAWHDPRTLPLRLARTRCGELSAAKGALDTDLRNVQRAQAGQYR